MTTHHAMFDPHFCTFVRQAQLGSEKLGNQRVMDCAWHATKVFYYAVEFIASPIMKQGSAKGSFRHLLRHANLFFN